MLIKPKALKKGDTVGLIAPSSPTHKPGSLELCVDALTKQGFNVVAGDSCREKYGYLSGKDEIRATDINKMFKDKSIDAVFCQRGGYGTPRILDMIDYKAIKRNPKLFIGYSDITAIHIALNQRCNLATLHGPMAASDMLKDFDEFTRDSYMNAITKTEPLGILRNPPGQVIKGLVPGVAKGIITGGNLSLIAATIGTPYEINTKDKLLLLEDVGEFTYNIDRMLTQLRLSGKLKDCLGIILGDFKDCVVEYPDFGLTLEEIFNDIIVPAGKPVIYNFSAGHCSTKITVPLGVKALLDANACTLTITESALV